MIKLSHIFKRKKHYPILDKYDIEFKLLKESGEKYLHVHIKSMTDANFLISGYFVYMGVEIFQDDILPNINRALNGDPFDENGGQSGIDIFLTIGASTSLLESANAMHKPVIIPTQDIKEIIEAWVDWVVSNKLENLPSL